MTGYAQLPPSTVGQIYNFCVGDSFEYSYSETEAIYNCGITATELNIITAYNIVADTVTYTYVRLRSGNHAPCPNYSPPYGVLFDSVKVTQKIAHPDSSIFSTGTGLGIGSCQGLPSSECQDSVYISTGGSFVGKKLNEYNSNILSSADDIWADSLGMVHSNVFAEADATRYITDLIFYHKVCTGEIWGTFHPFPDYSIYAGITDLLNDVNVYPNPAAGMFEMEINEIAANINGGTVKLTICNLLGQQMLDQQMLSSKIGVDCDLWPRGMYIWSICSEGVMIRSGKVAVQ